MIEICVASSICTKFSKLASSFAHICQEMALLPAHFFGYCWDYKQWNKNRLIVSKTHASSFLRVILWFNVVFSKNKWNFKEILWIF